MSHLGEGLAPMTGWQELVLLPLVMLMVTGAWLLTRQTNGRQADARQTNDRQTDDRSAGAP